MKQLKKALLLVGLIMASTPSMAQYVIMSGNYFLTHGANGLSLNATATTEFNPNTCIWYVNNRYIQTANSSGTAYTGNTYLQRNSFSLGGSSRWSNPVSDGNIISYDNRYYLRLNGTTWQVSGTNSNNGYLHYVTRTTPGQSVTTTYDLTAPTITSATAGLYNGENATFSAASTVASVTVTTPAHTKYAFNEEEYFVYDGTVYSNIEDFSNLNSTDPTSSGITYSWALSSTANATVNGSGVVTVNSAPATDQTVTLTCTARHTASGTTKTSSVSLTIYAETATPEIALLGSDQAQITCASDGATIYYTTDGSTPTASSTVYTGSFDLAAQSTTVKAIAIRNGRSSAMASEALTRTAVSPVITISNSGEVTITCATEGAVIHYTTDGSTPTAGSATYSAPFNVANMATVKAIAVKSGYDNSSVASQQYITTGISGNTLVINDYEDHRWTYYSDKPDGDYPDQLRSPNPRNVKITYSGGSVSGASAVAVSATESVNKFIYYKTIEQKAWGNSEGRWLTGDYAYQVIPNPFSKRPRTTGATGTDGFYGFAGWKIVSGGQYINGHDDNDVLDLEEKINFVNLDNNYSPNCTSAEIQFEATWTPANVVTVNDNITGDASLPGTGGTYETNFIVVTGNGTYTVSDMTRQATVMGCYPDGTTPSAGKLGDVTGNTINLKIENINLGNGTNDFSVNTGWLIVGRGCTGNVRRVRGSTGQIKMRIESGLYNFINPMAGGSANNANYGLVIFGNDYDRATNDGLTSNDQYEDNSSHRKLRVINYVSFNGSGAAKGSNTDLSEWMDITIKSGYYGFSADYSLFHQDEIDADGQDGLGLGIGGNTDAYVTNYETFDINNDPITYVKHGADAGDWNEANTTDYRWQKLFSFYCGRTRGGNYGGVNRVLVEGGELSSINGGGYRNTGNSLTVTYHFRMKGGWVKGAIYGTASASTTAATTKQIITGGEINGWIAGACNGTDVDNDKQGNNSGNTYIYLGGNAELRSHKKDGKYNNAWGYVGGVEGGNIFASGRGIENNTYTFCGSSFDTYAVVADDAIVEQSVYGGGYIGVAQQSHIYITGGEIGKNVYGGSSTPITTSTTWRTNNTDIRMYNGTVKGGIYGGHYMGSGNAGKIQQNVSVAIYGGQVGVDNDHLANIHGGGYGAGTTVGGNVNVTIGNGCNATEGAVIYGDIYGGSALGSVNTNTSNTTTVTLYKGVVNGAIYGGALGDKASLGAGHSDVAAPVNGNVSVKVFGGSVRTNDGTGENGSGGVFGCNNTNGTPMGSVNVDIYGTDPAEEGHEYALFAVYGGGNRSDFTGTPVVTIHGCSNRIEYVYGGGNASAVRQTDVTIWGGHIGNAFGGGNGFSVDNNHGNPSAAHYNPGANITSGGTHLLIHGGTVKSVFGGSNQYGTINGGINVTVTEQDESGGDDCGNPYSQCPLHITELFGGGNEAPALTSGGDYISPNVQINSCNAIIDNLYGGAKQAFHGAPITLNVTGGHFQNVFGGSKGTPETGADIDGTVTLNLHGGTMVNAFGGNDVKGNISGKITVNVLSNQVTCPLHVDNVFGGGQEAAYSPDDASALSPEVNIQHGTVNNAVFGGGLGSGAIVTANPKVTVGDVANPSYQATVGARLNDDSRDGDGNVFGGGSQAAVSGNTLVIVPKANTLISNNVFGGGSQAGVSGNTTVNMSAGTVTTALYGGCNTSGTVGNGTSVLMSGGTTTTVYGGGLGAGTTVDKGSASFGTSVTISGNANVTGNVFGGGNAGLVNGSTHVTLQQ